MKKVLLIIAIVFAVLVIVGICLLPLLFSQVPVQSNWEAEIKRGNDNLISEVVAVQI